MRLEKFNEFNLFLVKNSNLDLKSISNFFFGGLFAILFQNERDIF